MGDLGWVGDRGDFVKVGAWCTGAWCTVVTVATVFRIDEGYEPSWCLKRILSLPKDVDSWCVSTWCDVKESTRLVR
jgi:hypothetical protein